MVGNFDADEVRKSKRRGFVRDCLATILGVVTAFGLSGTLSERRQGAWFYLMVGVFLAAMSGLAVWLFDRTYQTSEQRARALSVGLMLLVGAVLVGGIASPLFYGDKVPSAVVVGDHGNNGDGVAPSTDSPTTTELPDHVPLRVRLTADDSFVVRLDGEEVHRSWSAPIEDTITITAGQAFGLTTIVPPDGSVPAVSLTLREGSRAMVVPTDRWEVGTIRTSELSRRFEDLFPETVATAATNPTGVALLEGWEGGVSPERFQPGEAVLFRFTVTQADLDALVGVGALTAQVAFTAFGFPTVSLESAEAIAATWLQPAEVEILVESGDHVLSVEAINANGPAGLLGAIWVGAAIEPSLVTSTAWQVSSERPDDAAWETDPGFSGMSGNVLNLTKDGVAQPWAQEYDGSLVHPEAAWIWVAHDGGAGTAPQLFARAVVSIP